MTPRKDKIIVVRITATQRQALEAEAKKRNRKAAELARLIIFGKERAIKA